MRNFRFVLAFVLQSLTISEGLFHSDLESAFAQIDANRGKFVGLPQGLALPIRIQVPSVLPGTSVIK